MEDDILPGTIGLTSIAGGVGKTIRFFQWLNGDGYTEYEHAFLYLGNGMILEAEPGGARIVPVQYQDVYWCRNIYKLIPWVVTAQLSPGNLQSAAGARYAGIGYSFLDYLALDLHRLHIPAPGLKGFIGSTGHEICSQLVDDFYRREFHTEVFTDKRWPGYVTPGSLYNRDRSLA